MASKFTRRSILPLFIVALIAPARSWAGAGSAPADAQAALRFRAIKLDLSPLRDNGSRVYADWLAEQMPAALNAAFAARMAPGDRKAPTLVVRIDSISLGPPGAALGFGGLPRLNDTNDFIEGAGIVVDPRGRTVGVTPLNSMLGADTRGPPLFQADVNHDRVVSLGRSFARWLPRQMGL